MRRVLLADADAFFVEVARQIDPEGAGRAKLLLVGGRPEQRGVVCSASYEARRLGVRSAMSMAQALRICPQAMVVPVPRGACVQKSRAIAAVLERYAPVVAPASIDEWYLDLSGTESLYGQPLAETVRTLRSAVLREVGLPLSFGGGTNKLVAKLAVELAKRPPPGGERGLHLVPPGEEAAFLTRFRLADIPMVGPKLGERLQGLGMTSVVDALPYDEATLCGMLGERTGRWLYARIRGRCDEPVAHNDTARSIGKEETFPVDISLFDLGALHRALQALLGQAMAELRRAGYGARTLTVKVKDADFTARQRSRTLDGAVESERVLWPLAQALLAELREARPGAIRLLGVSLSSLEPAGTAKPAAQLALWAGEPRLRPSEQLPVETERDRAVAKLGDRIRARFGEAALRPAQCIEPGPRPGPSPESRRGT